MRRFILLAHTAVSAPGFKLDGMHSTGGRLDVVARCVPAALLVSHGVRADSELVTLHLGPPTPPKALRFRGRDLRSLSPDERSVAGILEKALGARTTGPVWQPGAPGVDVAVMPLDELLGEGPLVVLDEAGVDVASAALPADATFVIGDHLGFTDDERALFQKRGALRVSVGPISLHADQAIIVLQNTLDRRSSASHPSAREAR